MTAGYVPTPETPGIVSCSLGSLPPICKPAALFSKSNLSYNNSIMETRELGTYYFQQYGLAPLI